MKTSRLVFDLYIDMTGGKCIWAMAIVVRMAKILYRANVDQLPHSV